MPNMTNKTNANDESAIKTGDLPCVAPASDPEGSCSSDIQIPVPVASLLVARLRRRRCRNGRRRNSGNRLLEGVQLLGHRSDLLGQLLRLDLLSSELVLNDLQLVDGLLLGHLKSLRRFKELV